VKENIDMNGKVVMITGANSGIGKETAIELAKMGANIIMVCRSRERGEKALEEIKEMANSKKIELLIADLADQSSIRMMVERFKKRYDKLHVLINNAGVMLTKRTTTSEGYESTFAINHIGHFLLTNLVLDMLKASSPSRIINVSSSAHKFAKLNFDDIDNEQKYRGFRTYANSKLFNILFSYELARRMEGTGVTVNTLHPGVIRTNLGKNNNKKLIKLMSTIFRLFMRSPKKGARTTVYLASSPDVEKVNGKYFVNRKPKKSSNISYEKTLQNKLWEISANLTNASHFENINLETIEYLLAEKAAEET
jgi:NAD(P)-dependent dehydrogenase (short-subunit alcohol dehydrogenase family)